MPWLYYSFVAGSFHTKKLCSRLHSIIIEFHSKRKQKIAFWTILCGGLRGNVSTQSIAHWKACGDFLFVITERLRYLLRLRRYKQKSVEVGVSRMGWVTLSAISGGKLQNIAISCGMRISAVHYLLLLQSMHVTDRQTDRIMTFKTAIA